MKCPILGRKTGKIGRSATNSPFPRVIYFAKNSWRGRQFGADSGEFPTPVARGFDAMARKKSDTTAAPTKKAGTKTGGVTATKKSASAETATKSNTPKPKAKKSAGAAGVAAGAAKKKAAPIKLNDRQREFLQR